MHWQQLCGYVRNLAPTRSSGTSFRKPRYTVKLQKLDSVLVLRMQGMEAQYRTERTGAVFRHSPDYSRCHCLSSLHTKQMAVECPCGGAVWLCPSRQLFGAMNLPRVMSTLTPTPRVRGGRYHYRRYCALCPTALIWLASTCSKGLAVLRPSFLAQFDWIPNRGWRNAGQHASPVPV
jgi:hypothetical protein